MSGHIEEGNFNDTSLDGLNWAVLMYWPGEVAEGNGTQQVIIDERADPTQREATAKDPSRRVDRPRSDAFLRVQRHDVDRACHALRADRPVDRCRCANGQPHDRRASRVAWDADPQSFQPASTNKSRINTPDGPHYIYAEMGNGNTTARAGIELDLKDSYGQFNVLHMNQDGLIR